MARVSTSEGASRSFLSHWSAQEVAQILTGIKFPFRLNALAGNLPGVKKASW